MRSLFAMESFVLLMIKYWNGKTLRTIAQIITSCCIYWNCAFRGWTLS